MLGATTPTWATLVLAIIGGGAVGTVLTTFWRIRHERAEAWRTRLLDAADDFTTGALQALMKLEYVNDWLWHSHEAGEGYLSEKEAAAMREADGLIQEARSRLARIQLLFGGKSDTGSSATAMIDELRAVSSALWPDPDTSIIEFQRASDALAGARDALADFVSAARRAAWMGKVAKADAHGRAGTA
jgi:hypothetical protein